MAPYIIRGDDQEASKSELLLALQELIDLADKKGIDRNDIIEILDDNCVTYEA